MLGSSPLIAPITLGIYAILLGVGYGASQVLEGVIGSSGSRAKTGTTGVTQASEAADEKL